MKGVKYVAPVFDHSGYAEASRNYVLALHKKGVPVCVEPHCFDVNRASGGTEEDRKILHSLVEKKIDYDVVVCQLTPDIAFSHREDGKYNISYFPWETSLIHPEWVQCLNAMDEVWVPCDWNLHAVVNSGVHKPVLKIVHGIDHNKFELVEPTTKASLGIPEDYFVFYNIFQWNNRKNPESLLRAYINAFSDSDKVALVLKTYVRQGGSQEQQFIVEQIGRLKRDMGLSKFPKISLVASVLSDANILSLHKGLDCFVSLHFAEGFGLTPFEAGLAGKPVIATGATGNMEFMDTDNSYPVDFQWAYVKEMSSFNRWYLGAGMWAAPCEPRAAFLMRHVFENRAEAAEKGLLLRHNIQTNFNWGVVADRMVARLTEIGA